MAYFRAADKKAMLFMVCFVLYFSLFPSLILLMLFSSILFMRFRILAGRLLESICPPVEERIPNSSFLGVNFLKDSGFLEYLFVHGDNRTRRFESTAFLRNAGMY
jgi:hypothetical protein